MYFCPFQKAAEQFFENNTATNNSIGVQIQGQYMPTIVDNDIYGNSLNVKLSGATAEYNLTKNWRGTTDQQAINATIYDNKNDSTQAP